MILIPAKYNHKCTKEINLLSIRRFFQKFFVKNEKIDKFSLKYYRCIVQPLVLRILNVLSKNINVKKFLSRKGYFPPPTGGVFPLVYKNIYYLTVANINKYIEFQSACVKIIHTIRSV